MLNISIHTCKKTNLHTGHLLIHSKHYFIYLFTKYDIIWCLHVMLKLWSPCDRVHYCNFLIIAICPWGEALRCRCYFIYCCAINSRNVILKIGCLQKLILGHVTLLLALRKATIMCIINKLHVCGKRKHILYSVCVTAEALCLTLLLEFLLYFVYLLERNM